MDETIKNISVDKKLAGLYICTHYILKKYNIRKFGFSMNLSKRLEGLETQIFRNMYYECVYIVKKNNINETDECLQKRIMLYETAILNLTSQWKIKPIKTKSGKIQNLYGPECRQVELTILHSKIIDILRIYNVVYNIKYQCRLIEQKKSIIVRNIKIIREEQDYWIDLIMNSFKTNDRCRINIACGLGKTLLYYWLFKKMKLQSMIIFVPSLYLLEQIYQEICSQSIHENYFIDFYYNSSGSGSNMKHISKFKLDIETRQIIISTYQSSNKFLEYCKNISFDLSVNDEAHHLSYIKTKDETQQYEYCLYDKYIKIRKRLSSTATEKYFNDHNVDFKDKCILSMDNIEIFGPRVVKISFGEAIKIKRLTDYVLLTFTEDIRNYTQDIQYLAEFSEHVTDLKKKYFIYAIVLIKAIIEKNVHHLLTFHKSIINTVLFKELIQFAVKYLIFIDEIDPTFKLYIDNVSGQDPMKIRNKKVELYNSYEWAILTSSQVFNEGINLPITNGIVFVDNRSGQINVPQCFGRPLRLYPGKELAYIFIPCCINGKTKLNENKEFRKLRMIIQNIAHMDNAFFNKFKKYKNGRYHKKSEQLDLISNEEKDFLERLDKKIKENRLKEKFIQNSEIGEKSFLNCKQYCIKQGFNNVRESKSHFKTYIDLPDCYPRKPYKLYKNFGWKGWVDFIGHDDKLKTEYENLKYKVQKENIKTIVEYNKSGFILEPNNKYKQYWVDWFDFFGINTALYPKTIGEWIIECRRLGIKGASEYRSKKNKKLPEQPQFFYKNFKNIRYYLK